MTPALCNAGMFCPYWATPHAHLLPPPTCFGGDGSCFVVLCFIQIVDERDKGDKLWELLTKLHENPPKADHGKTVSYLEPHSLRQLRTRRPLESSPPSICWHALL